MAQSTLSYLDAEGRINFWNVPWAKLNLWLSVLNGNPHLDESIDNVNRGSVIEELEQRRKGDDKSLKERGIGIFVDRGIKKDWREYENDDGYTHLEELIIYQPTDWRKQAREYMYLYGFDLCRKSDGDLSRRSFSKSFTCKGDELTVTIPITTPMLVALFHPEMTRTSRYGPLNFLLAYDVADPLPFLFEMIEDKNMHLCEYSRVEAAKQLIKDEISPLDYFFEFQKYIQSYDLDRLAAIGREVALPRLMLIKELDFVAIL